jgi:mono/diheme cytochrome c family protein
MLRRRRWFWPAVMATVAPLLLLAWTLTAISAAAQSPAPSAAGPSPAAGQSPAAAGAEQSPAPSASGGALPGDPQNGSQLYTSAGCTACHGSGLEGGVGPKLAPIEKLPDTKDPLDPNYLISTIKNGKSGVGGYGQMPPKGGDAKLTDKDIADIAAFIIQTNKNPGATPLGPVELARSNVFWITVAVLGMVLITYLLARYNMRWIARRNQARREAGRPG